MAATSSRVPTAVDSVHRLGDQRGRGAHRFTASGPSLDAEGRDTAHLAATAARRALLKAMWWRRKDVGLRGVAVLQGSGVGTATVTGSARGEVRTSGRLRIGCGNSRPAWAAWTARSRPSYEGRRGSGCPSARSDRGPGRAGGGYHHSADSTCGGREEGGADGRLRTSGGGSRDLRSDIRCWVAAWCSRTGCCRWRRQWPSPATWRGVPGGPASRKPPEPWVWPAHGPRRTGHQG